MSAKSTQGYQGYPVPVGTVILYAGQVGPKLPENYLICDGSIKQQSVYPELFSVIGTTYGSSGAGTFALPNLINLIPKCSNVAGTTSLTPTGSIVANPYTLLNANLPTIAGMPLSVNINGSFTQGSSASNVVDVDTGGAFPDEYPMTNWSTTSTVSITENSPPVVNYTQPALSPINFTVTGQTTFQVPTLAMCYIIRYSNLIF
jgi:microcystin-dependent protein